jgi:formylglycine-generating enzyme required for sulfatase activity
MLRRYAARDEDLETILATETTIPREPAKPGPDAGVLASRDAASAPGWPFDAAEAARQQGEARVSSRTIDLGEGVALEMVRVPAGSFVMGWRQGTADERPETAVAIDRTFWIGRFEVTNAQYARFDPAHDSHVESMHGYQFGIHGHPVDGPTQPVVRVSWEEARRFCDWLSSRTGLRFDLPTEAQWEYACRAGTATPFWFGGLEADYSGAANLGDRTLRQFALETYVQVRLIDEPGPYDAWIPRDDRYDDGGLVSREVGSYAANAWGVHDLHGNVREWTRSLLRPYPYREGDGRNDPAAEGPRVVRGGSWYDRPFRATSSYRLAYRPYQGVYDVGFRVVCEGP